MTNNVRTFAALNTLVSPDGNPIRSNAVAEPQRMTQPGSAQAAQGVSMQDMVMQAVQAAMAQMASQGVPQAVQTAPVAQPTARKATRQASVQTAPVARVQARATQSVQAVPTEDKAPFDPRTYYNLGDDLVATADGKAYVAQSTTTQLLVVIGVQRKAIALSVDKARLLRDMLNGLNLPE